MTILDSLEMTADDKEASLAHYQRLIDRIKDGSLWEYRGEMVEDEGGQAECVCGHPIRYIFPIYRKDGKDQCGLGSTCINHFEYINPEMFAALNLGLAKLNTQIAEKQKQARQAKAQAEVEIARLEFEMIFARAKAAYEDYSNRGRRAPYALWSLVASRKWGLSDKAPNYTRPCDFKQWYKQTTASLESAMAETTEGGRK